jgi:hypothetical protein
LFYSAGQRARNDGIPFTLTKAELADLARDSGGICPVAGVRFSWERDPGEMWAPFAPSLDRIQPGGPYSKENCRLICWAANAGKNNWTLRRYVEFCRAVAAANPTV